MESNQLTDTDRWVEEYGDYLYRFALQRVRDPEQAEELVQETFLAALKGRDSFAGQSSMKTWLVGILKHKIIDHYRKRGQGRSPHDLEPRADYLDDLYDEKGHWKSEQGPADWVGDPAAILERSEFWDVLRQCLDGLPARQADVFTLREVEQLGSEETCKVLNITPTNLWVMLHRARMGLRRCLELSWMGKSDRKRS